MRRALLLLLLALAGGLGLGLGLRLVRRAPEPPDPPAVALRIREVARLETLDVALYKKVTFAPEPAPADSLWGDVSGWLRQSFRTPRGKAIVFADAHLGLDLSRLDASAVRVRGPEVWVALPPIRATVELRPGETEIIGSNLDSAETARLLELARTAFQREVEADRALRDRARASAERQIGRSAPCSRRSASPPSTSWTRCPYPGRASWRALRGTSGGGRPGVLRAEPRCHPSRS